MAHYLLDTHVVIWLLEADSNLSETLVATINDTTNRISVSIATLWEMTIKHSLGKLELRKSLSEIFRHLKSLDINILGIREGHLLALQQLPFHHRDPFDRIIISQSISEEIALMSKDAVFNKYDITLRWE